MNYARHQISAAFPDLPTEDFLALRSSIAGLGVLDPITLYEGRVLDGWHRFLIAKELGIAFRTEIFLGARAEAIRYALARQVRRAMTKLERAQVLVALHAGHLARRGRRSKSAVAADFLTLQELAAGTGIGLRTLARAKRLSDFAVPSIRIVLAKRLISVEEAERLSSAPKGSQASLLKSLLNERRMNAKSFDVRGFLHENGHWITTSEQSLRWGVEIVQNGVPELRKLVVSGRLGEVAAVALARRPPEVQRHVLATAPWVPSLRPATTDSRWVRRRLKADPFYFSS